MKTILSLFIMVALFAASGLAAEKVKFGTSHRELPHYVLPILAAEEQGLWKESGLNVQWIPFKGGSDMYRAVAAGALSLGTSDSGSAVQAIASALPIMIVADLKVSNEFLIWVRLDSPIKTIQDLRGTKMALGRFGGAAHAHARVFVKAIGLEDSVRIVAAGGMPERIAALKAGRAESAIAPFTSMAELKVKKEVRVLVSTEDYLPKGWIYTVMFASRDLIRTNPDLVQRVVKATLKGADFIMKNYPWAVAKLQTLGYSEAGAREVFTALRFGTDGRIERKAMENLRNFFLEYGIIAKERAPAVDQIFTTRFVE